MNERVAGEVPTTHINQSAQRDPSFAIPMSGGLTSAEARRRLLDVGPNEIPEAHQHRFREFASKFWGPVAWMLEAALGLELALDKVPEAAILVALLIFNAVVAQVQEGRAQDALRLLRHRLQVTSRALRDGSWTLLPARELVPGDLIHLRIGDIVPGDCAVVDGDIEVDQAAITGESAPVTRTAGGILYSSSICRRGEASATVTATGPRTYFGKTAELVQTARTASHMEQLLFRIVRYLVTLDTVMALTVLVVATVRGIGLVAILPFIAILLIASVPAAMPATFTIANALESRRLVEQGVLVTSLTAVQDAATMDLLCVDKTGTLTEGRESLGAVTPLGARSDEEVLALAAAACDASTQDTVDLAVLAEMQRRRIAALQRLKFVPFDPTLKRSEALVVFEGMTTRVLLGSPSVVAELCVPDPMLSEATERLSATGARVLAVAAGSDNDLHIAGALALTDPPRADASELVRELHAMGIRVVMLTGDTLATARTVARTVGLGDRFGDASDIANHPASFDGFAGVYPEDKYTLVGALQKAGHTVGMTGDGVNGAPALKQAEVGIAVTAATDVARASAKLVLTQPGLTDIVSAVQSGRRVYRRMLTWTLNKVSKNFEQVFLLTVGFVAAGVFVVSPFLILLLVFANDFVSMSVGADRARISTGPDRWDVREIAAVAAAVGGSWLAVSLTLLTWALRLAHLEVASLQTFFFVYLVFSSQAALIMVREQDRFWASRPSWALLIAIVADIAVVSTLALTGTLMAPLPLPELLLVAGTVAAGTLAIDQVKVGFIRWSGAFGPDSRLVRPRPAVPG